MLKVHRKVLLKNRVELIRDIEPNEITSYLYQSSILSENDVDSIKAQSTRKARAELFLDTIPRKGPKAFNALVESLEQENGTKHLAEMLLSDPEMQAMQGDSVDAAPKPSYNKPEPKRATESIMVYPMNHKPHGLCLIINNRVFSGLPDRHGSDRDAKNLQELFSFFDFTVRKLNDATLSMMRNAIKEVSEADHSATDCIIVCLLSHGISGKIYDIHGQLVEVSQLLQPLIFCYKNPTLAEKPRLFFIQACRVPKDIVENESASADVADKAKTYEVIVHQQSAPVKVGKDYSVPADLFIQDATMPLPANILLSYSTVPGEPSWRNTEKGSWFIEEMVEVFRNKAALNSDVVSMLTVVNHSVSTRISQNSSAKQVPSFVNTLTKKLFLTHQP